MLSFVTGVETKVMVTETMKSSINRSTASNDRLDAELPGYNWLEEKIRLRALEGGKPTKKLLDDKTRSENYISLVQSSTETKLLSSPSTNATIHDKKVNVCASNNLKFSHSQEDHPTPSEIVTIKIVSPEGFMLLPKTPQAPQAPSSYSDEGRNISVNNNTFCNSNSNLVEIDTFGDQNILRNRLIRQEQSVLSGGGRAPLPEVSSRDLSAIYATAVQSSKDRRIDQQPISHCNDNSRDHCGPMAPPGTR